MAIHLVKGEKVIWESHPGKNYRLFVLFRDLALAFGSMGLFYYGLANLLGINDLKISLGGSFIVFLLGLIYSIVNQINYILIVYCITDERIIIKKGWLNRKLTSIKHKSITDTKVHQTFTQRMIKSGDIYIFTANDSNPSIDGESLNRIPMIENIDNPFKFHALVADVTNTEIGEYRGKKIKKVESRYEE